MNLRNASRNTPRAARNRSAWENPSNWSHRSVFGIYFAKDDDRLWVPKALPALGWTLNFAHPAGAPLLFAIIALGAATVVAAATWFGV